MLSHGIKKLQYEFHAGARVMMNDKCAPILKECEVKIKKQQEEKERRKLQKEQKRKEKEEQQRKKKIMATEKKLY